MGKVKAGKTDRRRSLGIREIDRLELRKQRDDPSGLSCCFSILTMDKNVYRK